MMYSYLFFFFQAEDGIRDLTVTGVQTCALPISFLAPTQRGQERLGYDIEIRKITAPLATTPAPARLDQNRIEQIRRRKDRKSTRLNSSHSQISYAVFCLKKKKKTVQSTHLHQH